MDEEGKPAIAVAGVGGAGCNTINRLVRMGVGKTELAAFNTDKKHLNIVSEKAKRCLIGGAVTRGLGAGGFPEVAAKAATSSKRKIQEILSDKDLVFITCGMGGGTGTGASPVIAQIAKEQGAIVIAFVTYPFTIERARLQKAQQGIENLKKVADTLVLIDNNRLLEYAPNMPIEKSFELLDEIMARAVRCISKTILEPSLLNLDYMDVRTVAQGGGISMIAVGEAAGVGRVDDLVKNTLKNRLLDVDIEGSKGVLLHITGGADLTLGDATRAGELLTEQIDPHANVIYGARMEESFAGKLQAMAIFTGLNMPTSLGKR